MSVDVDSGRAWVATVAVALANGVAFGIAYTFGTFFDSMADEFGAERGATAVIFGVTLLFFFGFGVISGPISDRVGAHRLLAIGGTLMVVGLLLTSRVQHLALGYVTYGVGVGLGSGIFTAPLTAVVGRMFVRRRAMALGVTATGNGLGTLILVPMSASIIERHGWRTAYVVLAAIAAVAFALAVPAVAMATGGAKLRATGEGDGVAASLILSRTMLADRFFGALFLSSLLMSIGLYIAFGFIVPFAKDEGVSAAAASRLVAIIGLSSIVGRLGLTSLTTRVGAVRMFQGTLVLQSLAYVIWLVAGSAYVLLVVFVVVLGVSYGGFVAMSPEILVRRFGVANLGARMGTMFLAFGLGGLVGPPAAGFVADASNGRTLPIILVIALLVVAVGVSTRIEQV